METRLIRIVIVIITITLGVQANAQNKGYYRFPSINNKTVVFTAEGDLYKYSLETKESKRLTSHHGLEYNAKISPDGEWVAFSAQYEGATEVYLMPIEGGIPQRITYEGERAIVVGWTSTGKILYSTTKYATAPSRQLVQIDPKSLVIDIIPLAQAAYGVYADNDDLYFERLPFQGSHTKRYKGGDIQQIWRYTKGNEAVNLTADYTGTSKNPMYYKNKIYFASDRDGTMNIWSMDKDGKDLEQLTKAIAWDIKSPDQQGGRIVYQQGADIWIYDIGTNDARILPISLNSDFDQKRVKWINNPMSQLQSVSFSHDGTKVAMQTRGRVFVAPVEEGRIVEVTRKYGVRYRNLEFSGESDDLLMLSDESGEVEIWQSPADGMKNPSQISSGSKRLIMNMAVSPDGNYTVYHDKDLNMYLLDNKTKVKELLGTANFGYGDMSWSPDSKWITYEDVAENQNVFIVLYNVESGSRQAITTERLDSYSPVWGAEKKWLYFLSDRDFKPSVYSPWGSRQPEPYYEHTTKIYALALQKENIPEFLGKNELSKKEDEGDEDEPKEDSPKKSKKKKSAESEEKDTAVKIDLEGLSGRLFEWPMAGKNINSLAVNDKYIYWIERNGANVKKNSIHSIKIADKKPEPKLVTEDARFFLISGDGKKILVYKKSAIYVTDADGSKLDDGKAKLKVKGWKFRVDPVEEWQQMFVDSWRLERDYFYDPELHGTNWQEILDRHLPVVERVTDRFELDDLMASMVSELSALHTFVYGGDKRSAPDNINMASLGARMIKVGSGYKIDHVYLSDPDYPSGLSPLAKPELKIKEGDIITAINGVNLQTTNPAVLLANQQGKEVRLSLYSTTEGSYDAIVKPISSRAERNLRYSDWEYSRGQIVEQKGQQKIGYLHLRAMGSNNYTEFLKNFYPVFHRQGLIIDVRDNRGGNIDSWLLEKLMRKAWFYFQPRAGGNSWNMQYAFRGHMVVLINAGTASDGEAFAQGFKRLGLGKVIGTRTWGGEIWLTSSNRLVDNGIATAAEFGVYSAEGEWLIEGHGLEPDFEVDNLPHATYNGEDAQLDYAINHLQELIKKDPRLVPEHPPYPDKSFDYKK